MKLFAPLLSIRNNNPPDALGFRSRSSLAARFRSRRQGIAPAFERMEGRALPSTLTVTSPLDSGPGSLRQAIIDARDGDTIAFDDALSGQAIVLTGGELVVDEDLTIVGLGSDQLA